MLTEQQQNSSISSQLINSRITRRLGTCVTENYNKTTTISELQVTGAQDIDKYFVETQVQMDKLLHFKSSFVSRSCRTGLPCTKSNTLLHHQRCKRYQYLLLEETKLAAYYTSAWHSGRRMMIQYF